MTIPDCITKRCTKCGQEFPATTEYFRWERRRQRLIARCWTCDREDGRERRRKWRQENPEEARRQGRETQRLLRQRRRDEINAKNRERQRREYWKDSELSRTKSRVKYHRLKSEKPTRFRRKSIRANAKRKALALSNTTGEHFTQADVELQYKSQKGLCWWCGKPLNPNGFDIDHRVPLIKGGSNGAGNICLTHEKCNASKNDKMPWEYNGRLL